jgi:DnaJ-class molecular chaperone
MAADPYTTLGVKKDASQDDIQKAYRKLAKKLHPDLNPGNKHAEERFKEISAAYDLLGDADKRKRFDHGEIDAAGQERPRQRYYRDFAEEAPQYASDAGFADFDDDLLSEIFGRQARRSSSARGRDSHYRLELDFLDAVNGGKQQISLPDGSALDVTIPPGVRDGTVLRLRGKGSAGIGAGPPGDALVEINVRPHHTFRRKGDDIHMEMPLPLRDAVLGGRLNVPTPTGPIAMKIPKWTNTGKVLRLRGRGVPRPDGTRGDAYVTLKVVLPDKPDPKLESLIADWVSVENKGRRQATG